MPFNDPIDAPQQCANPCCCHYTDSSSRYCTGCDQMLQDMTQELIDDALEHDRDQDIDCA